MFTGLIRHLGRIQDPREGEEGLRFWIRSELAREVGVGDSVAVDGVCLTVEAVSDNRFRVFLSPETLSKTHFGMGVSPDQPVHLERPLRLGDPLDGHMVLGHVDTVGVIRTLVRSHEGARMTVDVLDLAFSPLLVVKGSIAVDGVSLTINRIEGTCVEIQLIPHTLERTHFLTKGAGAPVNVEFDVIGKYVLRLSEAYVHPS